MCSFTPSACLPVQTGMRLNHINLSSLRKTSFGNMQDKYFSVENWKINNVYFCKVPLQQGISGIYSPFVSEGDRGVPDVIYPSSLARTVSVTFEIEGNENKVTKSIDFIIQSCSNFQGICTGCHNIKCFLFEQNRYSEIFKCCVSFASGCKFRVEPRV